MTCLEKVNVAISFAVVTCVLILGAYAVHLFLNLYNPNVQARTVSTTLMSGNAEVSDPIKIKRALLANVSAASEDKETRDANKPLWLLLNTAVAPIDYAKPVVYDMRSIASSSFRFWLLSQDGASAPVEVTRFAQRADGGLYLTIPAQQGSYDVLGTVETRFLFKPKVLAWENGSVDLLAKRFSKTGVAVWSVFLGLAAFSLCVAAVNRSFLFVIFSAWLVASLRVAGFNSGWDFNWLGVDQWSGVAVSIVRTSVVAYAFLTCILFSALFGRSRPGPAVHCAITLASLAFGLLIVFGGMLPLELYSSIFRILATFGLLTIAAGVVSVLRKGPSVIAWLYTGSYFLMIAGMLAEILFQASIVPALGDVGINSTGGSLAAAIVMSVALAAQIRDERNARQRAKIRELNALREFERIYTRTPIGLFTISQNGILMNANSTFREMFGIEEGTQASSMLSQLWNEGLAPECDGIAPAEQRRGIQFSLQGVDNNSARWYVVDLAAGKNGIDGSIHDVTARKTAELKLEYLASHDPVTDALNVNGFENAVSASLKSGDHAVLGQIGLDRFEFLYKIHGRQLADKVLGRIVELVRTTVTQVQVGRDGDKIFFLAQGDNINMVRESLTAGFRELKESGLTVGSVELMPEMHAGLCLLDGDGTVTEALLRANLTYEMAQSSKAGSVAVAEQNENAIIRELNSTRLAGGLEDYIKAGRFFLVAQPIVDIQNRRNKPSFELLLRMRGDAGEVIPPWQFVPAAEKMGLMSTLDRFVVAEAFRLIRSGEINAAQVEHISVNLSGSSLNDLQFLNDIYDLVTSTKVDLDVFCFELTESVALNSFRRTKEFLGVLKELGAKTAIDDFGAGHSSIHYLTELAPDYLKLDGSLITKVLTHPVHGSFVRKMVEIAGEVGVKCVGEFVETEALESAIVEMGVDYGQGYLYAAPLPIDEMGAFCAKWAAQNCLQSFQPNSAQVD